MIAGELIHPQILGALAAAGHGATVLIADAHYPASTATGPHATTVFLNLSVGSPTVIEILQKVKSVIAVERAQVITPYEEYRPCLVQDDMRALLEPAVEVEDVDRLDFYRLVRSDDLALCIVSGDSRPFANILLTVGVLGLV